MFNILRSGRYGFFPIVSVIAFAATRRSPLLRLRSQENVGDIYSLNPSELLKQNKIDAFAYTIAYGPQLGKVDVDGLLKLACDQDNGLAVNILAKRYPLGDLSKQLKDHHLKLTYQLQEAKVSGELAPSLYSLFDMSDEYTDKNVTKIFGFGDSNLLSQHIKNVKKFNQTSTIIIRSADLDDGVLACFKFEEGKLKSINPTAQKMLNDNFLDALEREDKLTPPEHADDSEPSLSVIGRRFSA